MVINPQVGETAGRAWQLLNGEGPQTLAQIKKKLNESNEVASLALGWLAREDKLDITQEKKNLTATLK